MWHVRRGGTLTFHWYCQRWENFGCAVEITLSEGDFHFALTPTGLLPSPDALFLLAFHVSLFFREAAADRAFDLFGLIHPNILNVCNGLGHFLLSPDMLYPFFPSHYTNQKQDWNCPDVLQSPKSEPASQAVPWAPGRMEGKRHLHLVLFFLSLSAEGSREVGHWALGPWRSGWGSQRQATTSPLPAPPPVPLWWVSHLSWQTQPLRLPPTKPSCPSRTARVRKCLCIPRFSPDRTHP